MGVGGIPFSAVDRYARRYGVTDVDEFDRLLLLIKAQDGVYLSIQNGTDVDPNVREVIPITDAVGIKSLLKRLAKPPEESVPSFPE